jgi:hypothetical protein
MNIKQFAKKLILKRKTVANLNDGSMDGIKGKADMMEIEAGTETNYMTCDGEYKCDTYITCQLPNCQAAA